MAIEPWREWHPLESPIWKIERANKHIESINFYVRQWDALKPYGMDSNLDATKTFYELRLLAKIPPFLDIGVDLGEFAYQLRSSLDQMVFAMCEFGNLSGRELENAERTSMFPILRRRDDDRIWGKLKFVPEKIRERAWEAINLVQPYQQGILAERDALSILDEMNIRDKHRVLQPVVGAFQVNRDGLSPGVSIAEGSLNDGDIVASVPTYLDPKVELDGRFTREIRVPIRRPAGGIAIAWISNIYARVAYDVLPLFFDLFEPLPATVKIPQRP
jgi:hypothetical protein